MARPSKYARLRWALPVLLGSWGCGEDRPDFVSTGTELPPSAENPGLQIDAAALITADQLSPERSIGTIDSVFESNCGPDFDTVWGFFEFETTTPGDSAIAFRIRAAQSKAELSQASYIDLIVAQSEPEDLQDCPPIRPGVCPVDVYVALGGREATFPVVELQGELFESSNGERPSIEGWGVSFSCPDGW